MPQIPSFPTPLHHDTAQIVKDYFLAIPHTDTVLAVNSCARGQAVPQSDLDFAILVQPDTTPKQIANIEHKWQVYAQKHKTIVKYKASSPFAHLHLDIINGKYTPQNIEIGEPIDYFEVEVGNQIQYSAPMHTAGLYYQQLQSTWLPYYNNTLQQQRLTQSRNACQYDLDHIPHFIHRALYFQAFDLLCKAFQEYLQTLFIANKVYPIAYNKWIKQQIVTILNKPDLYPQLSPILSVNNIESNQINHKALALNQLLDNIPNS
jgi:hypothetical protein